MNVKKLFINILIILQIIIMTNSYSIAAYENAEINTKEKEFCNYKYNIECEDIKIAVFEYYNSDVMWKKAEVPIGMSSKSKYNIGDVRKYNHPYKVVSIIRDLCPGAKIYFLPQTNIGVEKAIELNVDIVNFSASDFCADDELEKKLSENAIMFTSAGNEGVGGETSAARKDWWIAVGDCRLYNNDNIKLAKTSSYGKGNVFICGLSNIEYYDGSSKVSGTSFSSAFTVGLVAQYYQSYYDKFGIKPTSEQAKEFIKNNCYDMYNEGKDLRTGHGLFRLPEQFSFTSEE